jgi:DNA excision repair protein ERCC-4
MFFYVFLHNNTFIAPCYRYLLTYDAVAFYAYLETIVASSKPASSLDAGQYKSPWLLTDAANIIFRVAKRRCYTVSSVTGRPSVGRVEDLADDPDAWDVLDEIEDVVGGRVASGKNNGKDNKKWPEGLEPTLEELPKWSRLTAVLMEIEEEIRRQDSQGGWDSK